MGGESLRRRQVNVFHWNGYFSSESPSADKRGRLRESLAQPTAYRGYGEWRAATIRGYDPVTSRFEVKYHDEPKRSAAHIWLPLGILHFARNPPANAAAVRSSPDRPGEPSADVADILAADVPLADLIALNRHLELQQQRLLLQLQMQASNQLPYSRAVHQYGSPYTSSPELPASPQSSRQGATASARSDEAAGRAAGPSTAASAAPNAPPMTANTPMPRTEVAPPPAAAATAMMTATPAFLTLPTAAPMAPPARPVVAPMDGGQAQPYRLEPKAANGTAESAGVAGLPQRHSAVPTSDSAVFNRSLDSSQAAAAAAAAATAPQLPVGFKLWTSCDGEAPKNPAAAAAGAANPFTVAFSQSLPFTPRGLLPPVASYTSVAAASDGGQVEGAGGRVSSGAASSGNGASAGAGEVVCGSGLYCGGGAAAYDSPGRALAGYGGAGTAPAQCAVGSTSSRMRPEDASVGIGATESGELCFHSCTALAMATGLAPSATSFPQPPDSPLHAATCFASSSGSGCNTATWPGCASSAGSIQGPAGHGRVAELAVPAARGRSAGVLLGNGVNAVTDEMAEEDGGIAALYAEICSEDWQTELPRAGSPMRPDPIQPCLGLHDLAAGPLQQPVARAAAAPPPVLTPAPSFSPSGPPSASRWELPAAASFSPTPALGIHWVSKAGVGEKTAFADEHRRLLGPSASWAPALPQPIVGMKRPVELAAVPNSDSWAAAAVAPVVRSAGPGDGWAVGGGGGGSGEWPPRPSEAALMRPGLVAEWCEASGVEGMSTVVADPWALVQLAAKRRAGTQVAAGLVA